jgi:hypothetical protein
MKKIIIAAVLISASFASFAQETSKDSDEGNKGFKKENLFTGGDVTLSFSNYETALGLSPMLGYSVNKWLDAGVVFNFIYQSQQVIDIYGNFTGDKVRQFDYGPGAFVKLYPVNFLFIQAQFEENFITEKYVFGDGEPTQSYSVSAPSLLLGAGYCIGREDGSQPFFYLSVMADVLANKNSPYVEISGNGSAIIEPVIKGGVQIPLFQNGGNSYHRRRHSDY